MKLTAVHNYGLNWLDIGSRMGEKPTSFVELELWHFAALSGESASHPRDMKRFYRFVVRAHARQSKLSYGEVRARLMQYGFRAEIANYLAEAYWHGRCALAVSRKFAGDYARWNKAGAIHLT